MKQISLFSFILSFLFLNIVYAQDPCINRTWQNSYTTSWILNDGGTPATHIPHSIKSLTVLPNGTVATSCTWEEGGANVILYNPTGQIQNIPIESGTGGWGRNSMGVVALDDTYTYHLQSQDGCSGTYALNSNGLPVQPKKCGDTLTFKTVRRYDLLTGNPAPFPLGYGGKRDMLLVHAGVGTLKGIAIYKNELFVADELGDSVKVYNKTTMSSVPLRKFKFAGGIGRLSPDNHGGIWMLQAALNKIIRFDITTGALSGQEITFPAEIVPTALFVDTIANRILVSDNGVNQNIRIYTFDGTGNPTYSSSFGAQGGIFSGVPGKYAPMKFYEIQGVGADAQGNIYVGCGDINGSILQAYKPDGTLLWAKKGLAFVATACPDPLHPEDVYSLDKKVKMDYSKTAAGSEWAFDAVTLNRLKYRDDPRNHYSFTSPWVKYIKGQKFLFMTDMYGKQLAGYRFSPSTDGEVAIPCFLMNIGAGVTNTTIPTTSQPPPTADNELVGTDSPYPTTLTSNKDYIWMDKNGDGAIRSDEFTYLDGYHSGMSSWVDNEGNLWKEMGSNGARFIPLKEVNSVGVPIYDLADAKRLNLANSTKSVKGLKRIVYDSVLDELYITGFSAEKPDVKVDGTPTDTWSIAGSTVCMYKDVLKTLKENPTVDFQNVTPTWRIFIPFENGGPNGALNTKSITVEGDYMFLALANNGTIKVYNRSNGEFVGQISPGAEVGNESGWSDINYCINVLKTPTEYLIFNEEDHFAKVILYRMKSLATNDILFADLVPTDLKILNSSNQIIVRPAVNQPIKFSLKVKNIGPGLVPAGSTFTNGRSFLTQFTLKDLKTGIVTTILTDTCNQAVLSGDSIQLTTKAVNCVLKKGEFSISAIVSPLYLGANVTECNTANNTMLTTFNNYDSPYFTNNPVSQRVAIGKNALFSIKLLGNRPFTYQWFVNDVIQANSNDSVFALTNIPYSLNNAEIKCVATNSLGSATSTEAVLAVFNQNVVETLKISFQPAASNGLYTPAGYLEDNGLQYGSRGTYSYGWESNQASNTKQRLTNSDPTSSFLSLQAGNQNHLWKIALPAGVYYVTLGAGDPSYQNMTNSFLLNDGTTFTDLTPKTSNFDTYSAFVTVGSNGLLSFTGVLPYGNNATICYIWITNATETIPTITPSVDETLKINFQPTASNGLYTPPGYIVDNGNAYASRGTYSYGWDNNQTANTRQRINNTDPTSSLLAFQAGNQNHLWKIALDPGPYYVTLGAGDAAYLTTTNSFLFNDGSTLTDLTPKTSYFDTYAALVTVGQGGFLSFTGTDSRNGASVNYIWITTATPSAPTITGITPASGQLNVAFTAGSRDGWSDITNYKYSTDGGTSFTDCSPAQTSSPIVISGLTNGTTYNVKIKAVNANGDGMATASTAATPSSASSVENLKDNTTSSLRIYPNPASDIINIKVSGLSGLAKLSIVNLQGQVLYTRIVKSEESIKQDVSTFTSGIYFITINSNDKVFKGKFIIDRLN